MASEKELERMVIRFVGDGSSYAAMLKDAEKRTRSTARRIEKMGARVEAIGSQMTRIGTNLTTKVTAPLTLMAGAAIKTFADFDSAMTKSTSIMDVTQEEIEAMRQKALQLSNDGRIPQGPEELAEAYFFLASAGLNAEKSIASLETVAQFATAGAFDMAQATDLLTDAQSALGMTSQDANKHLAEMTRLSNVLVKANTMANASVQQFSEAITNGAGASLRAVNKDVKEGVAVLAAYADQGIKGAVAGSNLDRVLRLLKDSALKNAKAHEQLGFKVFDANGEMKNMADIVKNLEDIMQGMSAKEKAATLATLGFRAQVQQAIMPLLGMSETIKEYENNLKNVDNVTKDVADKQMKSFTNQVKVLWNQVKILLIQFGQELIPYMETLVEWLRSSVKWFSGLSEGTKQTIIQIGLLAAAIGPLLVVFGTIVSVVGQAMMGFRYLRLALLQLPSVFSAVAAGATTANVALGVIAVTIAGMAAAYQLGKNLFGVADFNKQLDESIAKLEKLKGIQSGKVDRRLKAASLIENPEEKQKALKNMLTQAGNDIKGYRDAITRTQKEIEKLEEGWRNQTGIGDYRIDELKQLQEEQKQLASDASERFKKIKKAYDESLLSPEQKANQEAVKNETNDVVGAAEKLEAAEELKKNLVNEMKAAREEAERELAQSGMSEGLKKIENFKAQGATEEELKPLRVAYARLELREKMKKLEEENKQIEEERAATAKAVAEQYATDAQRHEAEIKRLDKLKEEGIITAELHKQAMESLEKQYNKDYTAKFNFEGIQGVEAGSAEAIALMRKQAFDFQQAAMQTKTNPTVNNKLEPKVTNQQMINVPKGDVKETNRIVNPLERLVEIEEEKLTKQTQFNLVSSGGLS